MKDSYLTLVQEDIPKIPYQQAMEMSGYAQGYIDHAKQNSTHAFDDKFIDSVMVLCQFVKENHPQINMCITSRITYEEFEAALNHISETR